MVIYSKYNKKSSGRRRLLGYSCDSYLIFDNHRIIEIMLKDAKSGILKASLINLNSGKAESKSSKIHFSFGRLGLPYDTDKGRTDVRTDNEHYLIKNKENKKLVSVIHGRFYGKTPLIAEIAMENPFDKGYTRIYKNRMGKRACYSHRTLGYKCTGEVSVGDDTYVFNNANGIYKSLRLKGLKPNRVYYNVTFMGNINGNAVCCDILVTNRGKSNFYDGIIFYNGVYVETDNIDITYDKARDTYKITSLNSLLSVEFSPYAELCEKGGILRRKAFKKMYGSFSGKIIPENNVTLDISDFKGCLYVSD